MTGGEADARLAVAAFDEILDAAQAALDDAVDQAPISSPEEAAERDRVPGALKRSAHIVLLVNQERFDTRTGGDTAARQRVRELAEHGRLVSLDAEIRFETPYAAYQHDHMNLEHPQGGKPKYLEHAVAAARPGMRSRLEQVTR